MVYSVFKVCELMVANPRLDRVSEKDILLRQYSEKLAQSRQLLEQEVKFIRKVVFRARDELAKFLDQEKWRIHQTLRWVTVDFISCPRKIDAIWNNIFFLCLV